MRPIFLLCVAPLVAFAEPDAGIAADAPMPDEAGLESLLAEPVSTSASRTAESISDAPGTTWSISGTDLKRYGIQSVEEAIRYLGHGMTSYEYDARLNAAFGARGYMSDNIGLHIAVLIDGNQAGGSAKTARGTQQYMIPIELVDHIEVVLGPGSVVYGNSAMLGVINVITRKAATIDGTRAVVQVSAGSAADKWAKDTSWGEVWGRLAVYGAKRFQLGADPFDLAWHFAFRWDRQQGRSVWRPNREVDLYLDPLNSYSREDVFNRDLHLRLFANATWGKWRFLGSFAYGQTTGTGPIEGTGQSGASEPEYMLDATYTTQVGSRGDFSFRAYAVVFDSRAVLVPSYPDPELCLQTVGVSPCLQTLHYVNWRPFIEPILTWDWNRDGAQVTTLGAQAFIDGSVITSGTRARDGSKVDYDEPLVVPLPNVALYAQHIWRGRSATLNVGVRGDLGFIGWAVSPRVAISGSPWSTGTLKAVFSTGFRQPSITERFLEIENFLTTNPNLQPEHVYSAELDLAQRLGLQSLQVSIFGAIWDGLITTRFVTVPGQGRISQFGNVRSVWSAGINVGLQGSWGPIEYALSANYAPGRVRLPGDIASQTDEQLASVRIDRNAISRFGSSAIGSVFLPADGMPDFYANGHVSYTHTPQSPRFSVAATVNSERMRQNYASETYLIDPRNLEGPLLPWSVDVRGAVETHLTDFVDFRVTVTARSLATTPTGPRIGDASAPLPRGGIGASTNPVAPLSAMAELGLKL